MGHKTHPVGFRLGINHDWHSKWFASKQTFYREMVQEDLVIRKAIMTRYTDAGIAKIEIERGSQDAVINVHTSRPGIVIGRGGQRVEELRKLLEDLTSKKARLNIQEIRQPELNAYLVAKSVAEQLERRVAFRRAMRQALSRAMQAGAKGIKIICSGRLSGAVIARKEKVMEGRVPLHTIRAEIDYGLAEASTAMGRIGVKVWIYKGDIFAEPPEVEMEEMEPIELTLSAGEGDETEEAEVEATAKVSEEVEEGTADASAEAGQIQETT